ncbi:hypothetical protein SAMN05421734_10616 [Pelagirhabdus alkalitolerans]|uniref:Uncharacterized protein n=1 Tax=Pelagirhabdus alkalitolerans TaxID=1612202 RepID=A0A1G6KAU1_9BACI|nr:hypothetical protein [Pelagirhabdus alkalitolerans]SDC27941.1 hypothetical protein SAMN05421734_10616 [Pelagirhabdus alkalitolerans]
MKRDFNQAKNVFKYLEGRYGKIKKHSMNDDITLAKDMSSNHSLEELYMIKRRIQAHLSHNGENDYINNHLQPSMLSYFVALSTFSISAVTLGWNWLQILAEQNIQLNLDDLEHEEANEILRMIDPSSLFSVAGTVIIVLFTLLFFFGFTVYSIKSKKVLRNAHYEILVIEAITISEKNKNG